MLFSLFIDAAVWPRCFFSLILSPSAAADAFDDCLFRRVDAASPPLFRHCLIDAAFPCQEPTLFHAYAAITLPMPDYFMLRRHIFAYFRRCCRCCFFWQEHTPPLIFFAAAALRHAITRRTAADGALPRRFDRCHFLRHAVRLFRAITLLMLHFAFCRRVTIFRH